MSPSNDSKSLRRAALLLSLVPACFTLRAEQPTLETIARSSQHGNPANDPNDSGSAGNAYLRFVRATAEKQSADRCLPATVAEWEQQKGSLRRSLSAAWGSFPATPAPLQARKLGELQRDGYRVEKIVFQTFEGVWMTANAYVPNKPGRLPAVLSVHGHWKGAKQDPVVQSRALGLVKQGFFVLAVDAFGAGERGIGKTLGEYHGEMTAATLLPVGLPLSGLQVFENMRAVDYLRTRPEVDPKRIGITGASGGGNQTMYAGAWDERLMVSVPVCSVGNYAAYLGNACCLCEVVPGVVRFSDEWAVLGLTAPRALNVVSATRDSPVFSSDAAQHSMDPVRRLYSLLGQPEQVRHTHFDSTHAYNQPMREAMYGWMTSHLKGGADASPVPEPILHTEEPESLRCFPGESRPNDFVTLPRFAAAEGRRLIAARPIPAVMAAWQDEAQHAREALVTVLGGVPVKSPLDVSCLTENQQRRTLSFTSEPGIVLSVYEERPKRTSAPLVVVLDFESVETILAGPLVAELRVAGYGLVIPELRATGRHAWPNDRVGRCPDHNTAEWGLWVGRPLLGQWVVDVRRALDALELPPATSIVVMGPGPAGVLALSVGVLDARIGTVVTVGSLATFISDVPYEGQRLGIFAPGILREVGDIPRLAALIAPRKLVIAGGVTGANHPLSADALRMQFAFTRKVYDLSEATSSLIVQADLSPRAVVESFAR